MILGRHLNSLIHAYISISRFQYQNSVLKKDFDTLKKNPA